MRIAIAFVTLAVIAGCTGYRAASTDDPPVVALAPAPAGWAKICVFRDSAIGSALTVVIRDNGEVVGVTEGRGHFCYYASPGRHTLTTQVSDAAPFVVEAEPTRRYFVEHHINVGRDELVGIDEPRAASLAESTSYTVVAEAPEGEPLPAMVPRAHGHPRAARGAPDRTAPSGTASDR
jgi:hypothetical protein